MALMAALTLLLTDLVAAHASAQLARVRVLRSAVLWACAERIVNSQPLDLMRGRPQPQT